MTFLLLKAIYGTLSHKELLMLHSGNFVLPSAAYAEKCDNTVLQIQELKMLRQLFKWFYQTN